MANAYEAYLKRVNATKNVSERPPGTYREKLNYLKQLIREYVHENAALVDELEEVQTEIIIRQEERKFLLRKLCEYEPQVAAEVQNVAKAEFSQSSVETKKGKKRANAESSGKCVKMSDAPSDAKGAEDSLQSLQSMNINDPGEASNGQDSNKSDKQKIDILLKPTGNAPIMKKKKWTVDGDKPISWIAEFMKRYMKLEPQEKLFLYVNQTFAPSPDQIMKNLYDCYSTEGKLVLHYCKTPAWG